MPSTRHLRRRIRSVKNTSQITRAMQMVAASKMRKAQTSAVAGRPYSEQLQKVLAGVVANSGDYRPPLSQKRDVKTRAVILVTSDKGLCGSLNANILREAAEYDRDSTAYVCAGRKGAQFIARTKRNLTAEFTYKDSPEFKEARTIARYVTDLFKKGEVDKVEVVYPMFISTLTQKPVIYPFLPIEDMERFNKAETKTGDDASSRDVLGGSSEFMFEPSPQAVFEDLLPHYLNFELYQILLEAKASEHSARMVAMKNATDNAQELIKDLTLEYNKIRQDTITRELLDITGASIAMG
ncbi:MAG: ATP synthase F1 subunit gamma [Verrucomicrobia bacterium]|nr:ATP synthase F1 subunit gamma [Verrucomicrobiota bacterium]MCF7709266.1 ATP synthase F1 subunit gamma [Verrucomicrobiota bacterium]